MLHFAPRTAAVSNQPLGPLDGWFSALLCARGMDTPEKAERFLRPEISQLIDPLRMQDMDKAVSILKDAAENGKRVLVYGDYDCDGVCATAIMMETLQEMGIQASYRIPHRHSEGYGLNRKAVEEMAKVCDILLTVDCGVTNHEEVHLAQLLGLTVIVTDHHQLAETPSPADVVLNPLCGDYPFRRLCGAGVALKLTQALLGMEAAQRRMELAAIATVADLVPLVEENRVIVSEGLRQLSATKRPGLQALMLLAGITPPVTSGQVAFRIAPRINSGGRLEDAAQCVELLLSWDKAQAEAIASHLHEANATRQALQEEVTRAAEADIATKVDFYSDRVILVMGEGWNSGIIGLAAGRICEKYHFPAIVLSRNGDIAVGSCRSIPGVNIHQLLTRCSDLFIRFGGHEQAAGLTIKAELVPELRRRLNLYIDEDCDPACYIPVKEYDSQLPLSQLTLPLIEQLALLQPCGFGNPSPVFLCRGAQVQQARPVGAEGQHLKLSLLQDGALADGIAFRQGELARLPLRQVDVLFSAEKNEFRGQISPQMVVEALQPSAGAVPLPDEAALFPTRLQELTCLAANNVELQQPSAAPINQKALQRLLADSRSVLLVCHRPETAQRLAALGDLDVCLGQVEDRRAFPTVLLAPQLDRLQDVWHHIVLCDGQPLPGEAEAIQAKCPRAELHLLKGAADFAEALRPLAMDRAQVGQVYLALKKGQARLRAQVAAACSLSEAQVDTALTILSEMNLCRFTLQPWQVTLLPEPQVKRSLEESPLYRYLHSL